METVERLLPFLVCPECQTPQSFVADTHSIVCTNCTVTFLIQNGIVDFIGSRPAMVTPITRVLYLPGIIKIYEGYWRPLLCRLTTPVDTKKQLQSIQEIIVQNERDVILDVACGPGIFTRNLALAAPSGLIIGLDISMEMLQAARSLANANGVKNIAFIRADVHAMPFQANVFDGVNCCGALHLFPRPEIALSNINSVLKDGKIFSCLTFLNSPYFFPRLVQEILRRGGKFNFFDYQELLSLLHLQKFRLEKEFLSGFMLILGAVKIQTEALGDGEIF